MYVLSNRKQLATGTARAGIVSVKRPRTLTTSLDRQIGQLNNISRSIRPETAVKLAPTEQTNIDDTPGILCYIALNA